MSIKVIFVEDDIETQNWIGSQIRSDRRFDLSVATSFRDGLRLLDRVAPDILLADLELPDGSGLEIIRTARKNYPKCQIMVVTVFGDKDTVLAAIAAGAAGYILKDAVAEDIIEAIDDLLRGESPLSPKIARLILNQIRTPGSSADQDTTSKDTKGLLTAREIEVLTLASRGYNYTKISETLNISRHTVTDHVKSIYRKLEVHSRSQAIYQAVQQGYIAI